ncbi:syntaxin-binding protein 6-like [Salarias fasciatus]|uniref:syntaxin-binding protein 6-like n=1 Tax=Salarias fasciatus TaxID=181472 RepID=UPI001176A747|nr:syntaxin-binding protein 6-like [Salarias fasciatus]
MNIQSTINKEVFIPQGERLLVAVEVWRRQRKRMSFLPVGAKDYSTFICVSVTNTKPHQLLITKVKQFGGSSSFVRRSQWTVEQLQQVNGINPKKDTPEFDLVFDNTVDKWVTCSSAEKCMFVQILYNACENFWKTKISSFGISGKINKAGQQRRASQHAPHELSVDSSKYHRNLRRYDPPKKTEFTNCHSKLTGDASTVNLVIYRCKAFLNRMKSMIAISQSHSPRPGQTWHRAMGGAMGKLVQTMNVSVGKRGDTLSLAEDKTVELLQKAQQFADTAHMVT